MDLVARVKGLLLDPKAEWPIIEREPYAAAALLKGYVAILAAIPAVCGFVGASVIGVMGVRTGLFAGLLGAIGGYVLTFIGVFVMAFVIDVTAEKFGGRRSYANAFKIAVYTPTAAWLASAFTTIPILSVLSALGLYSLYLLYIGLGSLMKVPAKDLMAYFLTVIVCAIIVWAIILFLPAMLLL